MEIINIDKVTFNYPESESSALKDISLSIKEGELVLIVGPSGCGKSTLVRLLNRIIPDYYGGTLKGEVYIKGKNIENIDKYNMVKSVGMVYQHPEKQIILQDVEREIAFGLENLNTDVEIMKRNVAEVISLLGLNDIKDRQTTEISGGQKQRVAIASVVSMDPDIILFDEPISQLDPIAGEEVLNSIKKLNRDMGKTVILVEQRLDKCFHMADRIIFMEEGRIIGEGTPHDIPENIHRKYHLPNIAYIFKKAGINTIPVSVKEGREVLEEMNFKEIKVEEENKNYSQCIMEVNKLNFEYEKGSKTLNNINLKLHKGEIMSVMGENGAGKSTLFKIICGLIDSYTGKILIENENLKRLIWIKELKK
ncbi:cobalt transport ATP-binding protein [Clostridium tetanomorphum]|nr:cobalt transport ATP-binding protein [Clostridium tetanomorphum]